MAIGTLAELRTTALGLRTDKVGAFGDYLALAEERMYYGGAGVPPLRVLPMEQNANLVFTNGVATLPANYLDKRALLWTVGTRILSLEYEPPSVFYALQIERAGMSYPVSYTIEGSSVKIYPAVSGTAQLLYYSRAAALSSDPSTNDILTKWPGIYVFGTQIELYRDIRNDDEMAKALRLYGEAVMAANAQAIQARSIGGPVRRRAGFSV